MNREYHKWYSTMLQRDMELLVFGHSGRVVLFFPTRMARFYDYENWGIIEVLREQLEKGYLQIYCVDSVDSESFYNQAVEPSKRIIRHMEYERYIIDEVMPFIRKKNNTDFMEVAGCSMGAFHAANIGLKHPGLFNKVICMSGRYDLTRLIGDFKDLFDGYRDENIYYNSPMQFIGNIHNTDIVDKLRSSEYIFAIGETDPFVDNNHEFTQLLWEKGIPNNLYVWDNYAHKARYWRQMVQLYL
ncbi:esterase family protein [Mucilaginibacter sp. JRF]|uniref:esterase family protein n=1 Tax=Mucilaginibacter sp. JRF TaxID=2780088 RepID=UPI0018823BE3|nr:alpha/beta hydrolase-fold protein [Mucilaginibacter sp. JRF]MBE9585771.1 esterase family protein [Mucilaginibacter sp. JRF]